MREKLIELLKTIPQVNHAQAAVEGYDYVFGCAADYFIANGVTIQRWIPVTERLPDAWQSVLVYRQKYGDFCVCYYDPHYKGFYTEGDIYWGRSTHWIPLPEPPKGERAMSKCDTCQRTGCFYRSSTVVGCSQYVAKDKTNADRIRAMTDCELAKFLETWGCCQHCCGHERLSDNPLLRDERCDEKCEEHCLEWLQQPAEEDNHGE